MPSPGKCWHFADCLSNPAAVTSPATAIRYPHSAVRRCGSRSMAAPWANGTATKRICSRCFPASPPATDDVLKHAAAGEHHGNVVGQVAAWLDIAAWAVRATVFASTCRQVDPEPVGLTQVDATRGFRGRSAP